MVYRIKFSFAILNTSKLPDNPLVWI